MLSAFAAEEEIGSADAPLTGEVTVPGTGPRLAVVGFVDVDDRYDCDRVLARYGRCVEEVRFLPAEEASGPVARKDRVPAARSRNAAYLYAEMWEDLAYRWKSDERLETTLVAGGVTRLPTPAAHWSVTPREQRGPAFAVPYSGAWFDHLERERDESSGPDLPAFRQLTYHHPVALESPPPVVMLGGRLVERLAYDGKAHPYDIMDGDTASSGPFFEQMFPYDTALAQEGAGEALAGTNIVPQVPLLKFIADEPLKSAEVASIGTTDPPALFRIRRDAYEHTVLPLDADLADLSTAAATEFHSFYSNVGVQIVRFARREYTPTHLRVLTALIAMESPPSELGEGTGLAKSLVAASMGQTDPEELLLAEVGAGYYSPSDRFDLNYAELPPDIIDEQLQTFDMWNHPTREFLDRYGDQIHTVLSDMLRPDYQPLFVLDEEGLKVWAEKNAVPGRAEILLKFLKRIGLRMLVEDLDEEARDHVETSILLDHVRAEIRSTFVGDPGVLVTPAELEGSASGKWVSTLNTHGYYSSAIADGPGAVNPLAICTTKNRLEALEEPAFGAVTVDALVVSRADHGRIDELLWDVRDQLPFLLIDDPRQNRPEVTRLVLLPHDRAMYRIRWRVWTGWHLLWAPEPLDDKGEVARLALRTAAVCADTVLTPPQYVATVVRAALLEGELRPTESVSGSGRSEMRAFDEYSEEELATRLSGSVSDASSQKLTADTTIDRVEADPGQATAVAIQGAKAAGALLKKKKDPEVPTVSSNAVAYLRDVALAPLKGQARDEPLMVVVVDHSATRPRQKTWRFAPRGPYTRTQHRAGPHSFVRTSLWAYNVASSEPEAPMTMVAPGYRPSESVSTSTLVPRWRRPSTGHFTLSSGFSMFPIRASRYACPPESEATAAEPSTVVICVPGSEFSAVTEGFALDFAGLRTTYVVDEPRLGVEFGPEARLEMLHPGRPWFHDEALAFGTQFRFQFGLLVGLRHAPSPGPLWVRGRSGYPWGAPRPDGSISLGRFQYGVRTGALFGPGFNGLEGSVLGELWGGFSVRQARSKSATFTSYYPSLLMGPFVRAQLTAVLLPAQESRYFDLRNSRSLFVGFRFQARVDGKQPEPPAEVPQ